LQGAPVPHSYFEALHTLLDNMPFANPTYVRLALNYMFLWQVQKALSPWFLRRYERRVSSNSVIGFNCRRRGAWAEFLPN
jgi:hypothetical protein